MNIDTTHSVPNSRCPSCGNNQGPACGGSRPPIPGDISICFACGAILVFDDGLMLRLPTPVELDGLSASLRQDVMALSMAVNTVKAKIEKENL